MQRNLRRWLSVVALAAALPLFTRCEDEGPSGARFDLIVQNQTATVYDLFVNGTSGFVSAGQVGANGSITLQNLVVGTNYTFRRSLVGTGPMTFVEERTVSSTGADVTWTIT
jgi:hypothetical protein